MAVTAGTQATVGISYEPGGIACDPAGATAGWVDCRGSATLSGGIRTSPGGHAAVAVAGPDQPLAMSCTGGVRGPAVLTGLADAPALRVPLAPWLQPCLSWSGAVVSQYALRLTFAVDAQRASGVRTPLFTVVATAN